MEKMYCYVGDVLGFSDMISDLTPKEKETLSPEEQERFTPEERAKRVDSWIQLIKSEVAKNNIPHYQLVSDTVFVGVEPTHEGLDQILKFSQDMLNDGIANSLPIRAGITYGDIEWGKEISFGTAIVNAHKLEEGQSWIGTCCEENLPRIEEAWDDFEKIFCYPVPMKHGGLLTYLPAISWDVPEYADLREKTSVTAIRHKYVDWRYDSIIQNTMLFSLYRKLVLRNVIEGVTPSKFPGELMMFLEFYIDEVCHDKHLQDHGLKKTFQFK